MKILIAGSRSINDFDLSKLISSDISLIISGGAKGIDSIAEKYADTHKISKLILHPDYSRYGRAAPIKRNKVMVDIADKVIVIWDGVSRGSKSTIEYAKKVKKPIEIVKIDIK